MNSLMQNLLIFKIVLAINQVFQPSKMSQLKLTVMKPKIIYIQMLQFKMPKKVANSVENMIAILINQTTYAKFCKVKKIVNQMNLQLQIFHKTLSQKLNLKMKMLKAMATIMNKIKINFKQQIKQKQYPIKTKILLSNKIMINLEYKMKQQNIWQHNLKLQMQKSKIRKNNLMKILLFYMVNMMNQALNFHKI
ncbi:hypothetical protein TTHERM_000569119 (macronuclear) [Tetrahymena thermophila SB210]|uniref:Transmembrane protein n=1 Tax=Tetrahymena thermophila (strain SB210) TaxID=312017 RepID=W7X7E4_TETTS|nr:hypothetical protein TTHERM_000569119 [Tetrahymena thermophila SB210]EWS72293.1 hypothetical protein TTHERM_000569119 [Tetrahymena thermophila SB210]|eukprot:XP_012655233.1 hypothetical protein TTHERM_000569119 [Tetrahymena thermophila SB210]